MVPRNHGIAPAARTEVKTVSAPRGDAASASLPQPKYPEPGTAFPGLDPRFCRIRLLGCGGMGEVYLARDQQLGRPVAIKRIAAAAATTTSQEVKEAWLTAQIKHPDVVTVYDVQVAGDVVYIISEYIDGDSLASIATAVPWQQTLAWGVDIARALAAAHDSGILHRDIKPANVIVDTQTNRAKLIDFGVAKLVRPRGADDPSKPSPPTPTHVGACDSPTPAGVQPGTPRYQAPELWDGAPASPRTDVYALGALLYQMCTGDNPPRFDDADARTRIRIARSEVDQRFCHIVHQCTDLDPARRYASGREVLAALTALQAAPTPVQNPYRGLLAFQARHQTRFFGRETDIQAVAERVRDHPFVLLVGASGVGKSSLALAGVLPRLRELGGDTDRRWRTHTLVPGRRPLAALARCLVDDKANDQVAGTTTAAPLVADNAITAIVNQLRTGLTAEGAGLVLFVDQLEELLAVSDPGEAEAAGALLAHLIEQRLDCVRVLAAVRGDYLAELADTAALGPLLQDAIYLVRSLDADGMRAAIVEPAHATGVSFESPVLVDRLVADATHARGGMPLLQFALAALWATRDRERSMITWHSIEHIGGVAGALSRYADDVIDSLTASQQTVARRILIKLVVLHRLTRTRRTREDLVGTDWRSSQVLELLVKRRLVVSHADAGTDGQPSFSIAHEALLREWPRLRHWLHRERDLIAIKEHLTRAAQHWVSIGRPGDDALWGQRMLRELDGIAPRTLSAAESAFVAASRRAHFRARARKWVAALAVVAVIGSVYTGIRYHAHRDLARRAGVHHNRALHWLARGDDLRMVYDQQRAQMTAQLQAGPDNQRNRGGPNGDKHRNWEALWQQILALDPHILDTYRRAAQAAQAAYSFDPTRAEARQLLARVLDARARFADVTGRREQKADMLERLAGLDPDRAAAWRAPVPVAVATDPSGAVVDIVRYRRSRNGLLATELVAARMTAPFEIGLKPDSYLLIVHASDDRIAVRSPLWIGNRQRSDSETSGSGVHAVMVSRPRAVDIPPGFVYVPAGWFFMGYGQRPEEEAFRTWHEAPPLHRRYLEAFIVHRHEVAYWQWLEFLDACADRGCGGQQPVPRIRAASDDLSLTVDRTAAQGWQIHWRPDPTDAGYRAVVGNSLVYRARQHRRHHDWLDIPASGVSWVDAQGFLAWLRDDVGIAGADLCTDSQWERVARGSDQRMFPHGNDLSANDANIDTTYGRVQGAYGPDAIGSHPRSTSPFGVHDMAGNIAEMVKPDRSGAPLPQLTAHTHVSVRGGAFFYSKIDSRVFSRWVLTPQQRIPQVGIRICAAAPAER